MIRRFNELFFPHDGKTEHFRSLDGLRGIAVLFVLLSHSSNGKIWFAPWLNFAKIGQIGVYLFFVLSAYLLDRQIAIAFMSGKSSKMYWLNYFLRRFLRIYPLFLIVLLFEFIIHTLGVKSVITSGSSILGHMFLIEGKGVFWSIAVEFKYYFISPIIMWGCHYFFKWDLTKTMVTLFALLFGSMAFELYYHLPQTSTLQYFPFFLTGTILSIYELKKKEVLLNRGKSGTMDILGLITILAIIITIPYYFELIFGVEHLNFHDSEFYIPYSIVWAILLMSAKYGKGMIRKIFELKFLRFIGTISFSMYLLHMPVLKACNSYLGLQQGAKVYVFLILTIIISAISYVVIERPLSRIKIYR